MTKANRPSDAVVLIESIEGKVTGTGFAIHHEGEKTWILTCAHVVEDAGGADNIRIKFGEEGRDAKLVEGCCGSGQKIDLAVLQVDKLVLPVLSLRPDGRTGEDFQIPGFAELDRKYAAEPVKGKLGDQFPLETTGGPRITAWQLRVTGDIPLLEGYSGSPVVRVDTHEVLAVATHEQYAGKRGYAIDIAHLRDICRNAAGLLREDLHFPSEQRIRLKRLIRDMGISQDQMRFFCHRALPLGNTYAVPMDRQLYDLVDWLAGWGGEEWVPLLSVARQLFEQANEPTHSRLRDWIDKAAQHFRGLKVWQQALIIEEKSTDATAQSPVLVVEIGERTTSKSLSQVRFFDLTAGRPIELAPDEQVIRFDPASSADNSAIAGHVNHLLYKYFIDRERVRVDCILPDDLLGYPVEHWAYDQDGMLWPLGAVFPVTVRPSSRQHSGECDPLRQDWRNGWERQLRHHDRCVNEALCWVDASQKKSVINRLRQGYVCIGLHFIPTDQDFLGFLVNRGITAAIWPRRCDNLDTLRGEIQTRIGSFRLAELPQAVYSMRSDLWADERMTEEDKMNHPCYHLSLLWDDPNRCLPNWRPAQDEDFFPGVDYP